MLSQLIEITRVLRAPTRSHGATHRSRNACSAGNRSFASVSTDTSLSGAEPNTALARIRLHSSCSPSLATRFCPFDSLSTQESKSSPLMGSFCFLERVTGVEPVFRPWQGRVIAAIRYPLSLRSGGKPAINGPYYLWDWLDSNQRPSGYEPPALTAELQSRLRFAFFCLETVDKSFVTTLIDLFSCAWGQNRTVDTRIFSPLLYH